LIFWSLLIVSAATAAEPPEIEIARGHFRRGAAHYQAARFRDAAAEFELARRELPLAELDYDLGRCYEALDQLDDALAAYRRFREHAPSSATTSIAREEVDQRISLLEAASPAARERRSRLERAGKARRTWRVLAPTAATFAAIALGAGVASGVLYARTRSLRDGLEAGCPPVCDPGLYDRAVAARTASLVTFGVALGATAIDVALWGAALSARRVAHRGDTLR
jgi:tetratricopeptide (TPR) repeat protein